MSAYSQMVSALHKQFDRIAELEAELAATRSQAESFERALAQADAKLADWQRHGVKVSVDCETCGGKGWTGGPLPENPMGDCHRCGGTGKKPRDGAAGAFKDQTHIVRFTKAVSGGDYVVIPAEWLEAE